MSSCEVFDPGDQDDGGWVALAILIFLGYWGCIGIVALYTSFATYILPHCAEIIDATLCGRLMKDETLAAHQEPNANE